MTTAPEGIRPNPQQEERDRRGLNGTCSACGHPGAERDPLVIAGDGYRVHLSHVLDERDGYFGVPFAAAGAAA
jgi:hypothetical protein